MYAGGTLLFFSLTPCNKAPFGRRLTVQLSSHMTVTEKTAGGRRFRRQV